MIISRKIINHCFQTWHKLFLKGIKVSSQICLCLWRSLFKTKGSRDPPRAAALCSLESLLCSSVFLPLWDILRQRWQLHNGHTLRSKCLMTGNKAVWAPGCGTVSSASKTCLFRVMERAPFLCRRRGVSNNSDISSLVKLPFCCHFSNLFLLSAARAGMSAECASGSAPPTVAVKILVF